MLRRLRLHLPVVVLVPGAVCELVAFALPWARYRMETSSPAQFTASTGQSLFQAPGGALYLGVLLALLIAVAAVLAGPARFRSTWGSAAMVGGVLGAVLAHQIGARAAGTAATVNAIGLATVRAHGSAGTGVAFGTVGPVLLGFGALVAAWAASRNATEPAAATSGP